MSAARRVGSTSSKTRLAILAEAQQMMLDQGYAAISYRTLAAGVEVAPSLVQYYFPTLDDMFIALLQHSTERILRQLGDAADSSEPLRAAWKYASSKDGAVLLLEFMALANHREGVRAQIGRGGEQVRQAHLEALTAAWDRYGDLAQQGLTPASLLFMMSAIPRMMQLEKTFGTYIGHADTVAFVEGLLDRYEPRRPRSSRSRAKAPTRRAREHPSA